MIITCNRDGDYEHDENEDNQWWWRLWQQFCLNSIRSIGCCCLTSPYFGTVECYHGFSPMCESRWWGICHSSISDHTLDAFQFFDIDVYLSFLTSVYYYWLICPLFMKHPNDVVWLQHLKFIGHCTLYIDWKKVVGESIIKWLSTWHGWHIL